MKPSPQLVALRIALLFKRFGKTRARITDKTFRMLSERVTIRDVFSADVRNKLEDLGISATQLARGGFSLITISALDGAPPITVKKYLAETPWKSLSDDELWEIVNDENQDEQDLAEDG